METILEKIGDPRLTAVVGCIKLGNTEKFKEIQAQFPEYDTHFLWLVCYTKEDIPAMQKYIEANYKTFAPYLDKGFPKLLGTKGGFVSRMWEMIVADICAGSGKLIEKPKTGVDFHLESRSGQIIQVEAVAPSEAEDERLRSEKPDYSSGKVFTRGGNIEDMEFPILLRFFDKGIRAKESKYATDKPLIIAINSSKVVGLVSLDTYVLRRILFGLGYVTITMHGKTSLQQNSSLKNLGGRSFPVGIFRDPAYKHISGIIYTSQNPLGLLPNGSGWHNQGITYVPNPLATYKIKINFPSLRRMECSDESYREIDAETEFKSSVSLY